MTNIGLFEYATINNKSVDGVLGNKTRSGRMEGTDQSTELRRDPDGYVCLWDIGRERERDT